MATAFVGKILKTELLNLNFNETHARFVHLSPALFTVVAGRIKPTPKRTKAVTYEQAFPPPHIGHRKSWNTWNTSTIKGGLRKAEIAVEDQFIRKFICGTFIGMVETELIIKRQHNIVRVAGIFCPKISVRATGFLIGYTEELLSHWLHCIVKLEIQMIPNSSHLIFKYV